MNLLFRATIRRKWNRVLIIACILYFITDFDCIRTKVSLIAKTVKILPLTVDKVNSVLHTIGTVSNARKSQPIQDPENARREGWTDASEINITDKRFVASEDGRVFILGAVAKNSTPSVRWDKFAVYGEWYDNSNINDSALRCCYKYGNGEIIEQSPADFNVRDYEAFMFLSTLLLWHITCDKPHSNPGSDPEWVSISRYSSCNSEKVSYVRPYFAVKKEDGHLVITTKMAYSEIDPEIVVSFLETVRYFGVDKVIVYVYKTLNPVVKRVLRYYSFIGLVDYYTIELADSERTPRVFPPLNPQYQSDEWLVKRDALERSMGSTYFGIFDMDEFLIPSQNRPYKTLLSDLLHIYPFASNFFFENVHFLTDARSNDSSCTPHCSIFRRYVMKSPRIFNNIHRKMFLITSRVVTKTIDNHHVKPLPGFVCVTVPNSECYLRHYGSCKRKFNKQICRKGKKWRKDTSMIPWAESSVSGNIQKTMTFLNLSST